MSTLRRANLKPKVEKVAEVREVARMKDRMIRIGLLWHLRFNI